MIHTPYRSSRLPHLQVHPVRLRGGRDAEHVATSRGEQDRLPSTSAGEGDAQARDWQTHVAMEIRSHLSLAVWTSDMGLQWLDLFHSP